MLSFILVLSSYKILKNPIAMSSSPLSLTLPSSELYILSKYDFTSIKTVR